MKYILTLLICTITINSYGQNQDSDSVFNCTSGSGIDNPDSLIIQDLVQTASAMATSALAGAMQPEAGIALVAGAAVIGTSKLIYDAINIAFKNNAFGAPRHITIPLDKINNNENGTVIDFSDFGNRDKIQVFRKLKIGSDPTIVLNQPNTWWKGVVLFDKSDTNSWVELACVSDTKKNSMGAWNVQITSEKYLVLSKAKAFGVHTNMYLIDNFEDFDPNYDYYFNWLED